MLYERTLQVLSLSGDEPPAGLPKRFPLDLVQPNAGAFERHPVDIEHVARGVQQSYELIHFVEDGACELLAVRLQVIGRQQCDIPHMKCR